MSRNTGFQSRHCGTQKKIKTNLTERIFIKIKEKLIIIIHQIQV
jgi:hypothetical protein